MIKKLLIGLIGLYRRWISPKMPPTCRFFPTCSQYAQEAISEHGAMKGLALGAWRICRCNPFCKGGYDPVPPKSPKDKYFCDSPQPPPSAIMPPPSPGEGLVLPDQQ